MPMTPTTTPMTPMAFKSFRCTDSNPSPSGRTLPLTICTFHISYLYLYHTLSDGNETNDPGPELLSLAGVWGESWRKCEPTLLAPVPVLKVWPSQCDRLWERSFSASGGLASLGDQWPTPLFLHWEKSCEAITMTAWSPHYSEFCCSENQIRLIAFIDRVDCNELVAS